MATQPTLVALRKISVRDLAGAPLPTQKIKTEEDVLTWRETQGYRDYGIFLRRLNEAVAGTSLPWENPAPSEATVSTLQILEKLDAWIEEIPPLPTPQRFGNLAFRTWGKRLEDEAESLLSELLPTGFLPAIPHLIPYFLVSFGSFTRMDYGTGHETSFALFLLCLTLLRFFDPAPEQERDLVLTIFLRYLRLCWKLQDVYKLEPAGSQGVWGLDDYNFLGYIFGSAQLRDSDVPVSAILKQSLSPTNLYFLSISRILEVKSGPFHEHSSQLYSIACGVPHWVKVNSGLFKMYEAEVLGKRVVVQHIPLGGLLEWNFPHPQHGTPHQNSFFTATPAPHVGTSMPPPSGRSDLSQYRTPPTQHGYKTTPSSTSGISNVWGSYPDDPGLARDLSQNQIRRGFLVPPQSVAHSSKTSPRSTGLPGVDTDSDQHQTRPGST